MNKRQLCDHIIAEMERWRTMPIGDVDKQTKNEVITVMQKVVDGVAKYKQTYQKKGRTEPMEEENHDQT